MPENIYVAQTSAGGNTGADAANAKALSWLNDVANWGVGAGKVSAGDTVHLCGTFTGQLIVPGDGATGNPVTILFETDANFTSACWPSDGAINLTDRSWLIIDGGTNGLIQNTDNGTVLGTQNNSRGIGGGGSGTGKLDHGIVRNLTITDIYRNTKHATPALRDETRAGYCISLSGTDLVIEDNAVSDGDGLITYSAPETSQQDVYIRRNTLLRYNHGMVIGIGDTDSLLTNLVIEGNDFDDSSAYDGPPGGSRHIDGIIFLNNSYDPTSRIVGVRICGNHFGPLIGKVTTSAIFNSTQGAVQQCEDWYIYNNVFECQEGDSWSNGFISVSAANLCVFNNTCIGFLAAAANWGGNITFGGNPSLCKNNIVKSGSGLLLINASDDAFSTDNGGPTTQANLAAYFGDVYSDHNIFVYGNVSEPSFGFTLTAYTDPGGGDSWVSGGLDGLPWWQTWHDNNRGMDLPIWNTAHADPNSTSTAPNFVGGGDYSPAEGDAEAAGQGENLSYLFTEMGITPTDFNGTPRSPSGAWDIGAFVASDSPTLMGDVLFMTQTANSSPVTELVKRGPAPDGPTAEEVIHHSGPYPRHPDNNYVYEKHGTIPKRYYVFPGTLTLGEAQSSRP